MKKLLLITYHFPPDAEVGSVRPYELAKHLPALGFDTYVLTVEQAFAESPDLGYQPTGIRPDRIVRTTVTTTLRDRVLGLWRAREMGRKNGTLLSEPGSPIDSTNHATRPRSRLRQSTLAWLTFPDLRYGWLQPALRAGERMIADVGFDLILSTSPPRVAHIVAAQLSRRHSIPWAMDLRDPWFSAGAATLGARIMVRLQRRLFRRHATRAAVVVTNTAPLSGHCAQELTLGQHRFACIPNGLDASASSLPTRDGGKVPFSIGHFGQISGRRSAVPFLRGMRRWLDECPAAARSVVVRFIGSDSSEAQRATNDLGLGCVSFEPRVPRAEIPRLLLEQYVLLVLANDQPLQVPGKVYEYLASERRILACTELDSATAGVLRNAPGCAIAETEEEIARALGHSWNEHRQAASAHVERTTLLASMTYHQRAAQYADVLGGVLDAAKVCR